MGEISVRKLRARKQTVLEGMAHSENKITGLEDKISRLRQASKQLSEIISQLESIKHSVDEITVEPGKWRGKEENRFEGDFNSYQENVKTYVSHTEDAKDAMEKDISQLEAEKAQHSVGLSNLENQLGTIDTKIEQTAKG